MHLGNIYAALMSWLSVKSRGGRWILRIEDLDPQRSKPHFARLIEEDLRWLGLEWDEGGLENRGDRGPYVQSESTHIYNKELQRLIDMHLVYTCRCTRADIMATQAPHQSDGRIVYQGTCRPAAAPPFDFDSNARGAVRLWVPDEQIDFDDAICGLQSVNLAHHCGDFVLRRADGAWAYQFAVVVDDARMGITEVVRGDDLLLSSAQQIYLYQLLGYAAPQFAHLPLLRNEAGQRLSKRDASLAMDVMRRDHTAPQIIGRIAHLAGLQNTAEPVTPQQLAQRAPLTLDSSFKIS